MDADREPNLIPCTGDVRRAPELGGVFGAEDHECTREAGFPGPADDFTEIAGELVAGQMTVGIDHRTRAPAGRLGSTATRDGGPVSVLAASTIPCDSIPIIGRGFRLATTTIVRPTS